jgi:O-antigen/teichoic acid export membrane protein
MTEAVASPTQKPAGFRILRNAGSILLGDAGGDVLTMFAIGLSAVALGPAGFGTLSEAQAFMDPFDTAAGFGLAQVAITVGARRGGCDGTLRGTIFAMRAIFGLVAIVIANTAALATGRGSLLPIILVLSVTALFTPFAAASTMPFQFGQSMHRLVALPFLASLVRVATTYAALYWLNTPVGYQLSAGAAALASTVLVYAAARRYFPATLRPDRALAFDLLKLAWPAAALEIIVVLYSRASYFLLHQAGPLVQGEYAAAERLLRPVFGIAGALLISALPTLALLAAEKDFDRLSRLYAKSIVRVFLVVAPLITAACFVVPWILRTWFLAYAAAVSPFRFLAVGALFMLLNQLSTTFVIAMGQFKAIMGVAIINFAVYFALASQWIPRYQATGAAMATMTMEGINTMLQLVMVYWLLRRAAR